MRPKGNYMAKTKDTILPLPEYAHQVEQKAQPLAVTQITHPDAIDGAIHEGTYAGIRLVKGDAIAAVLSDGSVI